MLSGPISVELKGEGGFLIIASLWNAKSLWHLPQLGGYTWFLTLSSGGACPFYCKLAMGLAGAVGHGKSVCHCSTLKTTKGLAKANDHQCHCWQTAAL